MRLEGYIHISQSPFAFSTASRFGHYTRSEANPSTAPAEGCTASRQALGQGSVDCKTQHVQKVGFVCLINSSVYVLASAHRIFCYLYQVAWRCVILQWNIILLLS